MPCGTRMTLRLKKSHTCCTVVMSVHEPTRLTLSNTPMVLRSSAGSGPRGVTARGTPFAEPAGRG